MHGKNCNCRICQLMRKGYSYDDAVFEMKKEEVQTKNNIGYIIHQVYIGKEGRKFFSKSFHTHGLKEKYNHLDLEIVLNIIPDAAAKIFANIVERIKGGKIFFSGDLVEGVIQNSTVTFVKTKPKEENEEPMLRIILPDEKGLFPQDKECNPNYKKQFYNL